MKTLLIASLVVGAAVPVHASEYGCKVLLCLSNPASNGGPKGVAECVQPINQLFRDLRKGRPFPSCDLADGNDGSSYARVVFDPYDPCPVPLKPAAPGSYVVQGQRNMVSGSSRRHEDNRLYTLKGQPQVSEPSGRDSDTLGARACVGNSIGSYAAGGYDDNSPVNVFDQVVWQPAQSPNAIDVFVSHIWHQRVRW